MRAGSGMSKNQNYGYPSDQKQYRLRNPLTVSLEKKIKESRKYYLDTSLARIKPRTDRLGSNRSMSILDNRNS